jgi:hypothetical protein
MLKMTNTMAKQSIRLEVNCLYLIVDCLDRYRQQTWDNFCVACRVYVCKEMYLNLIYISRQESVEHYKEKKKMINATI